MTLFSLNISAKDRATGRFMGRVNRALVHAVIKAKRDKKLTQSQIAAQMEVDKSTISRIINGRGNLTLRTIGEISWVLGLRPDITFSKIQHESFDRANHRTMEVKTRNKSEALPHSSYPSNTTFNLTQEADVSRTGSSPRGSIIVAN